MARIMANNTSGGGGSQFDRIYSISSKAVSSSSSLLRIGYYDGTSYTYQDYTAGSFISTPYEDDYIKVQYNTPTSQKYALYLKKAANVNNADAPIGLYSQWSYSACESDFIIFS